MQLAKVIAHLADEKKAEDIVVLDMRPWVNFCDYFVICTGTSARQVRAIADGIDQGLTEFGHPVRHKQGLNALGGRDQSEIVGAWVLLDMGDVVVHLFESQARGFYELEYLWNDAQKVNWKR